MELQDLVRYRIQFNEDIESKWMLSGILTGVDMGSGGEEVSSGLKWCPNNIPLEKIRRDGETIKLKNSIKSSALVWGICPKIPLSLCLPWDCTPSIESEPFLSTVPSD